MERLFEYLEVSKEEEAGSRVPRATHRLYDAELMEMGQDVSLIVVLPPTGELIRTYYSMYVLQVLTNVFFL